MIDQPQSKTPQLITPKQACEILAISRRTLHSWTKQGVIPAIRQGGMIRYSLADLAAWIDEKRNNGSKA